MAQTSFTNIMKFGGGLFHFRELSRKPLLPSASVLKVQVSGITFCDPIDPVDKSEWPEHRKLQMVQKQPTYNNIKTPKMFKMIRLMRGPELVHNELIYKKYGVKALLGGRMKFKHFEAVRLAVNRKLDTDRMFALWRIDEPWQPLSKKGIGKTLGGGKGPVHHYCTPVRADRIIIELGGDLLELEAKKILAPVAEILPFPSRVISQEDLENEKLNEKWVEENNINPYTMAYVIRNNMGGCQKFLSKYDYQWFGKYR